MEGGEQQHYKEKCWRRAIVHYKEKYWRSRFGSLDLRRTIVTRLWKEKEI